MILLEMKRRLYTKNVLFSILGILIITIGLNFIKVNGEKELIYDLKQKVSYEGDIIEENLSLALKKVRDEKSEDYYYKSQIWAINGLVKNYEGVLYNGNKIEDYPDKYATEFYDCWRNKFKALIKRLPTSQQPDAMRKLIKVKTPFVQYSGHYFYSDVFLNMQLLFIIIIFLVTFFASGTYSDSFEDESIEIIRTTKIYKKNMMIRTLPVIFYGILLTLIATLGTVGIIGSAVGFKALKSSFKMISLFSFGNFSIGQAIMIMVVAEVIGILALSAFMGYISLKTKKTTTTIAFGVSLSIFYMIGRKIKLISTSFMRYLLNAIPMAGSQITDNLSAFSFNFGMWEPYAIMLEISMVFIIFIMALTIAIKRN
ncbi:hypothetical protein P9J83_10785 [Clostridium sporogenes]|uniref:Uncharacterized protein n=1 Tax=Clostridium sporogenes TaxID=1509 RepID=A0AAE4JT83_CLOSG|nr:hypothetical protein [Clostridium sporogenes]MDS1003981.1 hypothetical protein [Clostridium sporogenes]